MAKTVLKNSLERAENCKFDIGNPQEIIAKYMNIMRYSK
jgi:hypothetical protein